MCEVHVNSLIWSFFLSAEHNTRNVEECWTPLLSKTFHSGGHRLSPADKIRSARSLKGHVFNLTRAAPPLSATSLFFSSSLPLFSLSVWRLHVSRTWLIQLWSGRPNAGINKSLLYTSAGKWEAHPQIKILKDPPQPAAHRCFTLKSSWAQTGTFIYNVSSLHFFLCVLLIRRGHIHLSLRSELN